MDILDNENTIPKAANCNSVSVMVLQYLASFYTKSLIISLAVSFTSMTK